METLAEKHCEACRADAPRLSESEIDSVLDQIPNWELIESDGIKQFQRVYKFGNFVEAIAFANRVGDIAEGEAHHPALLIEWGKVTVTWWTHKIKGLHRNDAIMAAKTDALYDAS